MKRSLIISLVALVLTACGTEDYSQSLSQVRVCDALDRNKECAANQSYIDPSVHAFYSSVRAMISGNQKGKVTFTLREIVLVDRIEDGEATTILEEGRVIQKSKSYTVEEGDHILAHKFSLTDATLESSSAAYLVICMETDRSDSLGKVKDTRSCTSRIVTFAVPY